MSLEMGEDKNELGEAIVLLCAAHIGGDAASLPASSFHTIPALQMQDVNWLVPRIEWH